MKNRARKKYSTEFKREAVGLVLDHGYSKAEAGRSLDVNPNLIRRWQREFEADGSGAFPGQGKLTPDQKRIRDLEAENRRLRMEKDILKKATVNSMGERNILYFDPRNHKRLLYGTTRSSRIIQLTKSRVMGTLA